MMTIFYRINSTALTIEPIRDGVSLGVTQHKAERSFSKAVKRLRETRGEAALVESEGDGP